MRPPPPERGISPLQLSPPSIAPKTAPRPAPRPGGRLSMAPSAGFAGTLGRSNLKNEEEVHEMSREESIASLKSFNTSNRVARKNRNSFLATSRKSMMLTSTQSSFGVGAPDMRNSNGDLVFPVRMYENVNVRDLRRRTWGEGGHHNTFLYIRTRSVRCEIILSDDPDDNTKVHQMTAAEPEAVAPVSDSRACLVVLFDEPIGVEFPSEAKAGAFRSDLLAKLRRIEEVESMKGRTKFVEIYEKAVQAPIPLLPALSVAPSSAQEAEQAAGKYAVLPLQVATFGSNGNKVDVGYELQQEYRIINGGAKALQFAIELPQYCNRFVMSADTYEGTVEPGFTCSVRVRLIPLCTTVISDPIKVVITPGGGGGRNKNYDVIIGTDVQVKSSQFIDDDSLDFNELVGEGSFGTVVKGTLNGAPVAIKSLRDVANKQVREDFLREIYLLDTLRSPYVMELHGADINPGGIAMVTEYFPLGSLAAVMAECALTLAMKYRVLKDVAEGMRFLHAMGVVHRDLKPENILVANLAWGCGATCKIADMGSARSLFNKQAIKDSNGMGTPLYMAPEIVSNKGTYAKSADVYSFGILAVEVLNEKKPYSECEFQSPWALITHVTSGKKPVIFGEENIHTRVLDLISDCLSADTFIRPCKYF